MLQISALEFLLYETADETRWWAERGAIAELFTMRVSRFIRVNSPRAGAAKKRWFNAAFNYLHLAFKQPSSVKCVFTRGNTFTYFMAKTVASDLIFHLRASDTFSRLAGDKWSAIVATQRFVIDSLVWTGPLSANSKIESAICTTIKLKISLFQLPF